MKKLLTIIAVPALMFSLASLGVAADDAAKKKKDPNAERTVRGDACCAKCCLKVADECLNVITRTVKDKDGKDKQLVFWLASQDNHQELYCKGKTAVVAKGTVKREGKGKDAKMVLTASSVEKAPAKKAKGKAKPAAKS